MLHHARPKGCGDAWPTCNRGIDQTTFWRTKQTGLTGITLRDTVMRAEIVYYRHRSSAPMIIGMFSMLVTHWHSVSDKWQWPWGWVERGDSCPFANEHRSSDSFNNNDWYGRSSSCWMARQQSCDSLTVILEYHPLQDALKILYKKSANSAIASPVAGANGNQV